MFGGGFRDTGFAKSGGPRGFTGLKAVRMSVEMAGVEHLATDLFNPFSVIVGKLDSSPSENVIKPVGVC